MTNKLYKMSIRKYSEKIAEFLLERADLFTGLRVVYDREVPEEGLGTDVSYSLLERLERGTDENFNRKFTEYVNDFTYECINLIIVENYLSVPEEFNNNFYSMGRNLVNDCREQDVETWRRVCRAARCLGIITYEDARGKERFLPLSHESIRNLYNEVINSMQRDMKRFLPDNEWLTVEIKRRGDNVQIIFGEDLRHVVFREKYGEDRWKGAYHLPSGETI